MILINVIRPSEHRKGTNKITVLTVLLILCCGKQSTKLISLVFSVLFSYSFLFSFPLFHHFFISLKYFSSFYYSFLLYPQKKNLFLIFFLYSSHFLNFSPPLPFSAVLILLSNILSLSFMQQIKIKHHIKERIAEQAGKRINLRKTTIQNEIK